MGPAPASLSSKGRGHSRVLAVMQTFHAWTSGQGEIPQPPEKYKWNSLNRDRLFATPWTIQSREFSRSEYRCGQLFPSSGDLPNPGIESRSPTLQADSSLSEPPEEPNHLDTPLTGSLHFWALALEPGSLAVGLPSDQGAERRARTQAPLSGVSASPHPGCRGPPLCSHSGSYVWRA